MELTVMVLKKSFRNKKLIVFDMDGTLTPSKAPMTASMGALLRRLLREKKVAVIGGGKYELFKWQFVNRIKFRGKELKNLFLFPTSSTAFYKYDRGRWRNVYSRALSSAEKKKIKRAFLSVFRKLGYEHPKKTYGAVIEDRGTQITFSALGQRAPIPLKEAWNKKYNQMRLRMARLLQKKLRRFNVRVGGLTSIDVTEKGIDKAYGIRQIEKHLRVPRREMLFVGDAIFPGGNDYAVVRTGVDYLKVGGPEEARKVIRFLISGRRP
jgi:hypothetical protein